MTKESPEHGIIASFIGPETRSPPGRDSESQNRSTIPSNARTDGDPGAGYGLHQDLLGPAPMNACKGDHLTFPCDDWHLPMVPWITFLTLPYFFLLLFQRCSSPISTYSDTIRSTPHPALSRTSCRATDAGRQELGNDIICGLDQGTSQSVCEFASLQLADADMDWPEAPGAGRSRAVGPHSAVLLLYGLIVHRVRSTLAVISPILLQMPATVSARRVSSLRTSVSSVEHAGTAGCEESGSTS